MLLPQNSIRLYAGETRTLEFSVADREGRVQDLTSARVVMTVREDPSDSQPLFIKSTDDPNQAIIASITSGLVRFFFVPQDTQYLRTAQYPYDVWVFLPTGERYPVIQSSVLEIKGSVTRF
jgi:hypothetical protein